MNTNNAAFNNIKETTQGKHTVNLFSKGLLPKQPLINLTRVLIAWIVILLIMLSWGGLSTQTFNSLTKDKQQLLNKKNDLTLAVKELENKIKSQHIDPVLEEKLTTLEGLIENKRGLYAHLSNAKEMYSVGFANSMSELAEFHHKDISLQHVNINSQGLTLSGLAKNPDAVPLWLNGFESSDFLSGQKFNEFSISENEENQTAFIISTITKAVGE